MPDLPPAKESGVVREQEIRITFRADAEQAKRIAEMLKVMMSALTEPCPE